MKKQMTVIITLLCLIPPISGASPTRQSRTEPYLEGDIGYGAILFAEGAQVRLGGGVRVFPSQDNGFFLGLDAHVGTTIAGRSEDLFGGSTRLENDLIGDANALIGYQTAQKVDIYAKLGATSEYRDIFLPQATVGVNFPLTDHLKLTTNASYKIIGASARLGLQYNF